MKNQLIWPAAAVVSSLILGGFFFATQLAKQNSIEKQVSIKIAQENKEYVAKRKRECYQYYEDELDKWNNVESFKYSTSEDICRIRYKANDNEWAGKDCESFLKTADSLDLSMGEKAPFFRLYADCDEGLFTKEF